MLGGEDADRLLVNIKRFKFATAAKKESATGIGLDDGNHLPGLERRSGHD
jgi:hypothetical protein